MLFSYTFVCALVVFTITATCELFVTNTQIKRHGLMDELWLWLKERGCRNRALEELSVIDLLTIEG